MAPIERHWQGDTFVSRLLLPLSVVYCTAAALRREMFRRGWRTAVRAPVPVIVVGNITVGGTGKTPLVLWLARYLAALGYRPGIIARGYRGRARSWPQLVTAHSDPELVGDEPVLLARRSGYPVVADPQRPRGIQWLLAHECNVIVSDDGLQHYRLYRDLEIAVIDGERRFGNGRCLPAGPLRERPTRLETVDAVVTQGAARAGEWSMRLVPTGFRRVANPEEERPLDAFRGRRVHGVAGIGNPARFFAQLRALGADVVEHPFRDHHRFRPQDLEFGDDADVIMTEKDAVKCRRFAGERAWYLAAEAEVDPGFGEWLQRRLRSA
ncbi:MAG TPA: tetraacyldisaccharide 4'-kinase [Burkholderiales bacterium]